MSRSNPVCTGRCAAREFSQGACGVGVPRLAYSEVCAVGLHWCWWLSYRLCCEAAAAKDGALALTGQPTARRKSE